MEIQRGIKFMRILVFFDLPTETKEHKLAYGKFRKHLLSDGFIMLQYSVYTRLCNCVDNAEMHIDRLIKYVPKIGHVRVMLITDQQFDRIRVLRNNHQEKFQEKTIPNYFQISIF